MQFKNRDGASQTLACSDSLLVLQGIAGQAQKWHRHDWQGSGGPVSHADLWTRLLAETESQGTAAHWVQVPSHVGIEGNEKADVLADIGRRRSPLLRGYATALWAIVNQQDSDVESDVESDMELTPVWTGPERVGDDGTPLPVGAATTGEGGGAIPVHTPGGFGGAVARSGGNFHMGWGGGG